MTNTASATTLGRFGRATLGAALGLATLAATAGLTATPAQAVEGPVNDDFANAIALNPTSDYRTDDVVHASRQPGEPTHSPDGTKAYDTVWFSYTPTKDTLLTLSTKGSSYDTVLALYTGSSIDHLTLVANNDNTNIHSAASLHNILVHKGVHYSLALGDADGDDGGYLLYLSTAATPSNDGLAQALPVGTGPDGRVFGSNRGATTDQVDSDLHLPSNSRTVWYSFHNQDSGLVTFALDGSDPFDSTLRLYRNNGIGFDLIATDDNSGPGLLSKIVRAPITGGGNYYVAVGGKSGASGRIRLSSGVLPYPVPVITSMSPKSGKTKGGTKVTVKGQFVGVDSVWLNDTANLTKVHITDTEITFVTPPAQAGPRHLRISTPTTVEATQPVFTYKK